MGLGGASGRGEHVVVGLGATGLNLLDVALFLFSTALSFLMLGFVFGSGGLNWLAAAGVGAGAEAGTGPILPSTSRKDFIFLIIVGWG